MTSTVDWSKPRKVTRFCKGKPFTRIVYPVTCHNFLPDGHECGNVRWLKKSDAKKADKCFQCSQREKAVLGYAAMAAKYGEKWAVRRVQVWLNEHPSSLERKVDRMLRTLGIRNVTPNYWLATKTSGRKQRVYLIDRMITFGGEQYAIEINGAYIHSLPNKVQRDKCAQRLLRRRGIPFLVVEEIEIRDGSALGKIADFLKLTIPDDVPEVAL